MKMPKPRLVKGNNGKWYCGVGLRQAKGVVVILNPENVPYGSGQNQWIAYLKWRRGTDPLFRTRHEQQILF